MRVSLIVAMSENRIIGREGRLPWRLPSDLQRFKRLTLGHHLVMGRKTFESIGRLLPGRTSIVITRNHDYDAGGALRARGLDDALHLARNDDEVFIIGGEQIYRLALPRVDRMYITAVHVHVEGQARFPQVSEGDWRLVEETYHPADPENLHDSSFRLLERNRGV